jgi:hypothetical protein
MQENKKITQLWLGHFYQHGPALPTAGLAVGRLRQPSAKNFSKKNLCRRPSTSAVGKDCRQVTASVDPLSTADVTVGKALPTVFADSLTRGRR